MLSTLRLDAPADILRAVAGVGRTEDIVFSPDNRRVAVAGFANNSVELIDIEVRHAPEPAVFLTGFTTVRAPGFANPHGLTFLDDRLLAVANREGAVVILPVPTPVVGVESATIEPVMVIGGGDTPISSPGSLAAVRHGPELYELLVCNNYVHHVTRHVVDTRAQRVVSADVLLAAGLAVPDGIAVSNDGRWLAVSNHLTRSVLIFENMPDLGPTSPAVGELHDVAFPHGLRFTSDDAYLFAAAAGAPHVVVFERGGDSWVGSRTSAATIRVMDDDTFQRGHGNPQEGGPKGLDIDRTGRVVAITSEHFPLQFFAIEPAPAHPTTAVSETSTVEAMRVALLRALDRPKALELRATQLERELTEHRARITQLERAVKRTRQGVFEQTAQLEQARLDLAERDAALERLTRPEGLDSLPQLDR